jgi:hypothetical protein
MFFQPFGQFLIGYVGPLDLGFEIQAGAIRLAMKSRPSVDFCGYWQRAEKKSA